MKEELIEKLFQELEKDKEVIKQNLLKVMNEIYLNVENEYTKISLIIKIEGKDNNV